MASINSATRARYPFGAPNAEGEVLKLEFARNVFVEVLYENPLDADVVGQDLVVKAQESDDDGDTDAIARSRRSSILEDDRPSSPEPGWPSGVEAS